MTMLSGRDAENEEEFCKLEPRNVPHIKINKTREIFKFYTFDGMIGRGNFGTVFRATEHGGIAWAIKVINKRQTSESRFKLYEREIMILKRVNHPNIIHLECLYESSEKFYLVFELCDGELSRIFDEKKTFSEQETRKVIHNLASAVSYLHRHEIVHRDLKLENILVAANPQDIDDYLFIKVTDFGLSIVRQSKQHMLDEFCGTLTYMSPEMIDQKLYTQQCDIWAMGVIMYLLLTGQFPFYSHDEKKLCELIRTKEITLTGPPWDSDNISLQAKKIIVRMLNKNPAYRITAAEMVHHPWLENKPNSAMERETILELMRKWEDLKITPVDKLKDSIVPVSSSTSNVTVTQSEAPSSIFAPEGASAPFDVRHSSTNLRKKFQPPSVQPLTTVVSRKKEVKEPYHYNRSARPPARMPVRENPAEETIKEERRRRDPSPPVRYQNLDRRVMVNNNPKPYPPRPRERETFGVVQVDKNETKRNELHYANDNPAIAIKPSRQKSSTKTTVKKFAN